MRGGQSDPGGRSSGGSMRALDLERENAGAGGAVSGEEGSRPAAGKDEIGRAHV